MADYNSMTSEDLATRRTELQGQVETLRGEILVITEILDPRLRAEQIILSLGGMTDQDRAVVSQYLADRPAAQSMSVDGIASESRVGNPGE